jgi:ectoine hydroxylase-related dioxygenase (phytanoyl-CoA dioxygenase family)
MFVTNPFAVADAHDLAALRQCMDAVGHVVVRQAVNRRQVTDAASDLLAAALGQGLLRREGTEYAPTREMASVSHGTSLPLWQAESFHALAHADELTKLARGLLQAKPIVVHPRKIIRFFREVDNEMIAGWHQDWPAVQGSARVLTMWLPLVPTTEYHGSPLVIGGRLRSPQPMHLADNIVGREVNVPSGCHVHSGPLDPGDVLIFDAFTVHRGGSSMSNGVRVSCDFRYQSLNEPICFNSVELVGCGFGWADVYRDWRSTDLQYYWRRHKLAMVPYDDRFERWRDVEAIRLGRKSDAVARRALELASAFSPSERIATEARRLLAENYSRHSLATSELNPFH